jgi:hypothetical protein
MSLEWPRKPAELPGESAFVGIGEIVAVFNQELAIRVARYLDRRPELFDRMKAAFSLAVGANNAIRRLVAGRVNRARSVWVCQVFCRC